jgi:hypothetical protein
MNSVYYRFEKQTGCFAGETNEPVDDAIFSVTSIPYPFYDFDSQQPIWDGSSWSVINLTI